MKPKMLFAAFLVAALALPLFPATGLAANASPFVGHWVAIDYFDASDMQLVIGGPPYGPFQITWTERYISFCGGKTGLARGTGKLNADDPNLLDADLLLKCFRAGTEVDFHVTWRYDLATDTISWTDGNGATTTWHHSSLIAAARREGSLNVIALPNDWCNYGAIIQGFSTTYGIPVNSVAPGADSATELQAIRDGIDNPGPDTPDAIDVGPGFAVQAQSEGLITPYRVSAWNMIPDFMKDSDAYWYGDYYGLMAIATNTNDSAPPTSWQDLLTGEGMGPVALGGDPTVSNLGFFSVYGSALANGGSLDNIDPGLQFFRGLNDAGRLLPEIGNEDTLVSGDTPVLPEWSYLALAQRDANPEANIEVVLPGEGAIASFYAQAISASAPHPNAARLWMEYLYSDVGQLAWLQGYCFPARYDNLRGRGVIPQDLLDRLPDPTGAAFPTVDQIADAKVYVEENWVCTVYGCPSTEARIVASSAGDWFWTTGFTPNTPLTISIFESPDGNLLWGGTKTADESGFVFVDLNDHSRDLLPGNYLVVSDGFGEKTLVLESITIDVFDLEQDLLQGTAPAGRFVRVTAAISGDPADQTAIETTADSEGAWSADFPIDIIEEMRPWSFAQIYDDDGDANEAGPPQPPLAELWTWALTYDLPAGAWPEGTHSYNFETSFSIPEPGGGGASEPVSFSVSDSAPAYEGSVVLRVSSQLAWTGSGCEPVNVLQSNQPTRFLVGWVTDFPMTYEQAQAHFENLQAWVHWDGGEVAQLERHELLQADEVNWESYVCSYTSPPSP